MSESLAKALVETGMLETGLFQQEGQTSPFRFRLEMLPSYPDVLATITDAALPKIQAMTIDRLICPLDALPFSTVLSLKSGIPLVYSRGRGESPVFDLMGAYDAGHPACLVVNVLDDAKAVQDLMRQAKSVGLNIGHVLAVVDTETVHLAEIPCQHLLMLTGIVEILQRADLMTPLMGQSLLDWQRHQA